MKKTIGQYMEVRDLPNDNHRITLQFEVLSKRHGNRLGVIAWYGTWRQYVFSPEPGAVYNDDCLRDIAQFLESIRTKRVGDNWA